MYVLLSQDFPQIQLAYQHVHKDLHIYGIPKFNQLVKQGGPPCSYCVFYCCGGKHWYPVQCTAYIASHHVYTCSVWKCLFYYESPLKALLLYPYPIPIPPHTHRPRPSQAFTPYSVTLGNIVQELHRSLLLAMATESQHNTLTQVVRTLAQLVANCPYHQLSDGYVRRVTVAIERYSTHRGAYNIETCKLYLSVHVQIYIWYVGSAIYEH